MITHHPPLPASLAANARRVNGDVHALADRADQLDAQADWFTANGERERAAQLRFESRALRTLITEHRP